MIKFIKGKEKAASKSKIFETASGKSIKFKTY
jgi:hypothetical protein